MSQYDFHERRARPDTFLERNSGFLLLSAFWIAVILWYHWPSLQVPQMAAPVATALPASHAQTGVISGLIGLIGPFALAAVVIRFLWKFLQIVALYIIAITLVLTTMYYLY